MSQDPVKIVLTCILFIFIIFVVCRYIYNKNKNNREIKTYINFITLKFPKFVFRPNICLDNSDLNNFNILIGADNVYTNRIIEGKTDRNIKFKLGQIIILKVSGALAFLKVFSALSGQGASVARIPGSRPLLKGLMLVSDVQEPNNSTVLICTNNLLDKYKFDTKSLKNRITEDELMSNNYSIFYSENSKIDISNSLLDSLKDMDSVFPNGFFIYLNNNNLYIVCLNEELLSIKSNKVSSEKDWNNCCCIINSIVNLLDNVENSLVH